MKYERYTTTPRLSATRRIGSVLLLTLAAGCSTGTNPSAPRWSESAGSAASASANPEASASVKPLRRGKTVQLAGKVCDGFLVQSAASTPGEFLVVGRPLLSDKNIPLDVAVPKDNTDTIKTEPIETNPREQLWYTLDGKKAGTQQAIHCEPVTTLYTYRIIQPNKKTVDVVSTLSSIEEEAMPTTWDAEALNPSGFEGVGINYGSMPAPNVLEIMEAAQK